MALHAPSSYRATAFVPQVAPAPDFRRATALIPTPIDDSVQVVVAPHGAGMIQLAQRATKGARVTDLEYRGGRPGGATPDSLVPILAKRVGLEKRGDRYAHVGIGFCSHLPDTLDTAVLSNVVLENAAGKVR